MNGQQKVTLTLALLGSLLLVSAVLAAPMATSIDRWVLAGGGGQAQQSPYALDGTIGQPLVGWAQNAGYQLSSGFLASIGVQYRLYLPPILRDYH